MLKPQVHTPVLPKVVPLKSSTLGSTLAPPVVAVHVHLYVHLHVHLHVNFICAFTRARSNVHLAVNQAAKWLDMKASMNNGVKGFS